MTTKHTPGPWKYSFENINSEWAIVTGPRGAIVANVNADSRQEANAALIAAAPDLLGALVLLEREMVLSGNACSEDYGWKPAIEETRAAIAKAEGRS